MLRMHTELGMSVAEIARFCALTRRSVQYALKRARGDQPDAVPTWEALGEKDLSYIERHPKYKDPAVREWLMSMRGKKD